MCKIVTPSTVNLSTDVTGRRLWTKAAKTTGMFAAFSEETVSWCTVLDAALRFNANKDAICRKADQRLFFFFRKLWSFNVCATLMKMFLLLLRLFLLYLDLLAWQSWSQQQTGKNRQPVYLSIYLWEGFWGNVSATWYLCQEIRFVNSSTD